MTTTTSTINRNFKIKVFGFDKQGKKLNTLVGVSGLINLIGVSGLINLIGDELADKFVNRAFRSKADKCVCKQYDGLQVTFYVF